jgi:hypothetical protein
MQALGYAGVVLHTSGTPAAHEPAELWTIPFLGTWCIRARRGRAGPSIPRLPPPARKLQEELFYGAELVRAVFSTVTPAGCLHSRKLHSLPVGTRSQTASLFSPCLQVTETDCVLNPRGLFSSQSSWHPSKSLWPRLRPHLLVGSMRHLLLKVFAVPRSR